VNAPAALAALRERVRGAAARAGRSGDEVTLLGVAKGTPTDRVVAAVRAGLSDVGENYLQEAAARRDDLARQLAESGTAAPRWHFIGRLQRNKVRALAPLVSVWQSIDRLALVDEVARRAPGARVLLQVDATAEPQKGGCPPTEVPKLLAAARAAGLEVAGLMAVGPAGPPSLARPAFRTVNALADDLGLHERSMGMTGDLEVAVEEGSTMVRVGTALFGRRAPRP
jgi:hypothetical protein